MIKCRLRIDIVSVIASNTARAGRLFGGPEVDGAATSPARPFSSTAAGQKQDLNHGRVLPVRVDIVLHPSVGDQPDHRDQDVGRDTEPHPQQGADYAEQVNQRADPALEVASERLPHSAVRSTGTYDTELEHEE